MAYVTPEYVINDLLQEYKGNINTNDDLTKFKIAVRKIVYAFNKQASSATNNAISRYNFK